MVQFSIGILWQSWVVLGEMAPYLLFGFGVAGLLSVLISPEWTQQHLGGRGLRPVIEAALWGVPLPLCSCSVIPVAVSMRRHGASRAATTAFLLSTPQTGVDSIAVTYALLGPVFALFRPIAALLSGMLGGVLVLLLGESPAADPAVPACEEPCCTGEGSQSSAVVRAVRYGYVTLPRDLAVSLLVGVLIAGAVSALVPPQQFHAYLGGGLASILIAMAVGIPLYVCATASVPIAVGLMHMGASPGTALAFLIAGPATNAATLTTIWKFLGRRTAMLYLLTVALSATLCGLLLDVLVPWVHAWLPELSMQACHMEHAGVWSSLWAVTLLAVLGLSYLMSRRSRPSSDSHEEMKTDESGCCCHHTNSHLHAAQ